MGGAKHSRSCAPASTKGKLKSASHPSSHGEPKKNASDHQDDAENDESHSLASSVSSIPLRELKKRMDLAKKKGKKKNTNTDIPREIKSSTAATNSSNSSSDDTEKEEPACCLCHCGVDYSDPALFFPKDRKKEIEEEEEYYFTVDDPYLPEGLFDRHNALVYCDTCTRLYHQKCHFVPLLILPRGKWSCMICCSQKEKVSSEVCESGPVFPSAPNNIDLDSKELVVAVHPKSTDSLQREKQWELATASQKTQLWHRQLKQMQTFLNSQAGNIRMAQAALETLTSTKRNRAHFTTGGRQSQELAQTLVRLSQSKFKIRTALQSMENIKRSSSVISSSMLRWCTTFPEHERHVFPYGRELFQKYHRTIPRTREIELKEETDAGARNKGDTNASSVPREISLVRPSDKKYPHQNHRNDTANQKVHSSRNGSKAKKVASDDDSGISLDDLQCCVCLAGDATDDNDLLLCDGEGCCRAFHMKCVHPQVTLAELEDEEDDWFCPLCSAISHFMENIQPSCMQDEDWETRRLAQEESDSLKSWENVRDIFPESEWEFLTASKLRFGKQNPDTQRLLGRYLGEGDASQDGKVQMHIGSDSEDENDYSLFDEDSFDKRRQDEREEIDSASEMSNQEMKIGKVELNALSDGSVDSDDDSASSQTDKSEQEKNEPRKSRRLQKRTDGRDSAGAALGADFDESNIVSGKRRRNRVDYCKLNDALFGTLSAKEKEKLDDTVEFVSARKKSRNESKARRRKRSSKSTSDSSNNGSDSGAGSDSDSSNGSQSSNASSSSGSESAESQSDENSEDSG